MTPLFGLFPLQVQTAGTDRREPVMGAPMKVSVYVTIHFK
jgi:hypothetical protein